MANGLQALNPDRALRLVLAAGLLLMLGANLPGHLSYDSVAQLHEGHFHVRETWGPAIYAWLLGLFDAVIPGTSLYVAASGLLFFASLAGLAAARGRVSWLAVAFAVLMALTPQVLIYQGIVWKDIAFANAAIGGCACLAQAFARWDERRSRWLWLASALLLLSAGSLVRQNGALLAIICAIALGWVGGRGRWRRGLLWGGGGLVVLFAAIELISIVAVPQFGAPETGAKVGVRIVENYDLMGAVALDPSYPLAAIQKANPSAAETIRVRGPLNWSPDRIDWLDRDTTLGLALEAVPDPVATRQWLDLILHHPKLYLRLRWADFSWVFLTPQIDRCLPVYTGIDAPAEKMQPLGLVHRYSRADAQLTNYDSWYLDTPVQMHWVYALAALAVAGLLLIRRQPADLAVAALMLGALAVTASFFVISIACDYRYLYILDMAALVGLFYLALDTSGLRRAARG
ncbi:MAG TPA: hypothetical protein VHV27_02480 [Phenylobacterium sp.]|nr:hypothetical protein [Phenylobacterium sp.]